MLTDVRRLPRIIFSVELFEQSYSRSTRKISRFRAISIPCRFRASCSPSITTCLENIDLFSLRGARRSFPFSNERFSNSFPSFFVAVDVLEDSRSLCSRVAREYSVRSGGVACSTKLELLGFGDE